jgi:hypothetical protein
MIGRRFGRCSADPDTVCFLVDLLLSAETRRLDFRDAFSCVSFFNKRILLKNKIIY